MRDLNWIQGSVCISLHGKESVNVIGIKGIQKGTQRAALFQAFVGRNLPGNFVAINKKVEASCVHGLDDISQILWSLDFLQVSPKFLCVCVAKVRMPLGPESPHRERCNLKMGAILMVPSAQLFFLFLTPHLLIEFSLIVRRGGFVAGILHRSRGDRKLPTTRLKRTECW